MSQNSSLLRGATSDEKRDSKLFQNGSNEELRGATAEIIEVEVETLGIHQGSLVRPLSEEGAYELAEKDHSRWEPIEICMWPDQWEKPTPAVRYRVVSGNHRTRAAQIKQLATLRARLVEASDNDPEGLSYLVPAISSNLGHGKNFTKEEYAINARKLHDKGMSITDIANLLGYNKSTISRWITGNDSHAASKRQQVEASIAAEASNDIPLARNTVMCQGKQKVMALLVEAQMQADVEEARTYVLKLKPAQVESLRHLIGWLQEVMEG